MVSYYKRFLAKIFVYKKPVKFGMKIWFLASFHGYQFTFQVCTGKDISADGPITSRVVDKLIEEIQDRRYHEVYCDNFQVDFTM